MKKILITLLTTATISLLPQLDMPLAEAKICKIHDECPNGQLCDFESGVCRNRVDILTNRPAEKNYFTTEKYPESQNISNLPKLTLEAGIGSIIKTLLGWAMMFTIVAVVAAGIYYLISRGKEESTGKAKEIILYLIIGMAIMAAAYGIVAGITQFNYFD
ncbi:MAG: hypothetical protein AAB373_02090 [Patescibacteria group bacterium]